MGHLLTDPLRCRTTRRAALAGSAAAFLAPCLRAIPGMAADLPVVRIGTLPFGTVQWEVRTIIDSGLDTAAGIKIENVPLASNDAARIALLSRSVDAVVDDLLFAARLKAEGKSILFMPHSTTEGGVMVAASSPIRSVADLKGKALGISGGPLDKNWLLLRAAAKQQGVDLVTEARQVFGAPPLLAAKLESGELDASLLYWSACARLSAKGYREVVAIEDVAAMLGAKGRIALGGFLVQSTMPPAILEAFAKAARRAEMLLAEKPEAWTKIRPLMQAPSEATFEALKEAYVRGIPRKPRDEEIADAQAFYAVFARLGGPALVGPATSLPESLYVDRSIYG